MDKAVEPLGRALLRQLMLPLTHTDESGASCALMASLSEAGIAAEDAPLWLASQLDQWRETGTPTAVLRKAVRCALLAGSAESSTHLANGYFELHRALATKRGLTHAGARGALSYANVIVTLAQDNRMTASRIAAMLSAPSESEVDRWRVVQDILARLKAQPRLEKPDVERVWCEDEASNQERFADADMPTAIDLCTRMSDQLGIVANFGDWLAALIGATKGAFVPYLQILHYQCTVAELFDHQLTNAYEMAPRGTAADWLCGRYAVNGPSSGNPFLNNMKAVEAIDMNWAAARTDHTGEARALVNILTSLDGLAWPARRELAKMVRGAIHRWLQLAANIDEAVAAQLGGDQVARLRAWVTGAPTRTQGIIEQRVVDALASLRYSKSDGWRGRGLGDAVNATNTSSAKLGDCDFQHMSQRKIVAVEAHAGNLSEVYRTEHVRTLKNVLNRRSAELQAIADLDTWACELVFVAHAFGAAVPVPESIAGLPVTYRYVTFDDFWLECTAEQAPSGVSDAVRTHVVDPVNSPRCPSSVRAALRSVLSLVQ